MTCAPGSASHDAYTVLNSLHAAVIRPTRRPSSRRCVARSALALAPRHTKMRFRHLRDLGELGVTLMKGKENERAEGAAMIREAARLLEEFDGDDPSGVDARADARSELRQSLALV